MGPYSLRNNVGVWVVCVTPRLSLINGIYVGHLQWDSMRKSPTAWANIYGFGLLGMEDNIFARDGKKFTETALLNTLETDSQYSNSKFPR